jgi:hypothetical protein
MAGIMMHDCTDQRVRRSNDRGHRPRIRQFALRYAHWKCEAPIASGRRALLPSSPKIITNGWSRPRPTGRLASPRSLHAFFNGS